MPHIATTPPHASTQYTAITCSTQYIMLPILPCHDNILSICLFWCLHAPWTKTWVCQLRLHGHCLGLDKNVSRYLKDIYHHVDLEGRSMMIKSIWGVAPRILQSTQPESKNSPSTAHLKYNMMRFRTSTTTFQQIWVSSSRLDTRYTIADIH